MREENTNFDKTYLDICVGACLIYSRRLEMMQKMMKDVRWLTLLPQAYKFSNSNVQLES